MLKERRWKLVALLAAGMAIGIVMVGTPAGAHVGGTVNHLWNKHIKPKADARYGRKTTAKLVFRDAGVTVGNSDTVIATMTGVPAGTYVIFAKTYLDSTPIGDASGYGYCRVVAGADFDESSVNMGGQAQQVSRGTLSMQLLHKFTSTGSIVVQCRKSGGTPPTVTANMTKITRIKVDSGTRVAVDG